MIARDVRGNAGSWGGHRLWADRGGVQVRDRGAGEAVRHAVVNARLTARARVHARGFLDTAPWREWRAGRRRGPRRAFVRADVRVARYTLKLYCGSRSPS